MKVRGTTWSTFTETWSDLYSVPTLVFSGRAATEVVAMLPETVSEEETGHWVQTEE